MKKSEALNKVYDSISMIYTPSEAQLISKCVIEDIYLDQTEIEDDHRFKTIINELLNYRPLQYVTGKAYFMSEIYFVNENVLIPRPETEELVRLVLEHMPTDYGYNVLDIGTGSGCIACSIALRRKNCLVTAIDISMEAIAVAQNNAERLGAKILAKKIDILSEASLLSGYDFVVSNPPYIASIENKTLDKQVLEYEPHIALFSNDDPLKFYKVIATWAITQNRNVRVFVEINEKFGQETKEIFELAGYRTVEILKDMQGKDRFISAK